MKLSKLTYPINREAGIFEIVSAEWERGNSGELNIFVHRQDGNVVHAWLTLRPEYCDRGHIQLDINGIDDLDSHDSFPRFFFSFWEANEHTRTFLKWRLWKERTFPHVLEVR